MRATEDRIIRRRAERRNRGLPENDTLPNRLRLLPQSLRAMMFGTPVHVQTHTIESELIDP
jgi:hypothetical protein